MFEVLVVDGGPLGPEVLEGVVHVAAVPEDLEHLSPLQHEQVNLHGRYVFSAPDHLRHGLLRPLATPSGR